MPLTYTEIAEIVKLIDASSLDELVIEIGDVKLAVRRKAEPPPGGGTAPEFPSADPAPVSSRPTPAEGSGTAGEPAVGAADPAATAVKGSTAGDLLEVRAPMSGIFYCRPSPDADPFVSPGDVVHKGDPLCLVEVMKLFNTIHAELDGRIVEVGAEDGQLVEYQQILFVIEPE